MPHGQAALGVQGGMGGQQETVGSKGKEEGWSDDRSMDVSTSPENGLVQAKEDGQSPHCFQGSSSLHKRKRACLRPITQTQYPPQSSQVQTNTDAKETHQRAPSSLRNHLLDSVKVDSEVKLQSQVKSNSAG